MLAKINPTSPRGIIPMPTEIRSSPFSNTPKEQACFPTTATAVRIMAKVRILGSAKVRRSTRTPIRTKNIGTRNDTMG